MHRLVCMCLIGMFIGPTVAAGDIGDHISISGYYKNYSTVLDLYDFANESSFAYFKQYLGYDHLMGSVSNRLRLQVIGRPCKRFSITAAYDFSPRIQDMSLFHESMLDLGLSSPNYRVDDFDRILYPDEGEISSFAIYQNLDRLFATINMGPADIYIGRQAIAWGSARVINPTDILAPYMFNDLDVEDRRGIDAVRVRVPLGFMSEIDAGYVAGNDFKSTRSAGFLRAKYYLFNTDISALGIRFNKNTLVGLDISRALGGAGTWVEAAYVFGENSLNYFEEQDNDYLRISVGADYSFRDGTYIFGEYHYNGAGYYYPDERVYHNNPVAYGPGSVYLIGKHYLAPGIIYKITPLLTATGQALINLRDPSAYVMPSIEYNISDNIYLSGGFYYGSGDDPTLNPPDDWYSGSSYTLHSEFGAYPDMAWFSMRVYF